MIENRDCGALISALSQGGVLLLIEAEGFCRSRELRPITEVILHAVYLHTSPEYNCPGLTATLMLVTPFARDVNCRFPSYFLKPKYRPVWSAGESAYSTLQTRPLARHSVQY